MLNLTRSNSKKSKTWQQQCWGWANVIVKALETIMLNLTKFFSQKSKALQTRELNMTKFCSKKHKFSEKKFLNHAEICNKKL